MLALTALTTRNCDCLPDINEAVVELLDLNAECDLTQAVFPQQATYEPRGCETPEPERTQTQPKET